MVKLSTLINQTNGNAIICGKREEILDAFMNRQPIDTSRCGIMLIDSIRRLKSSNQWDLQGESLSAMGGITKIRVTFPMPTTAPLFTS